MRRVRRKAAMIVLCCLLLAGCGRKSDIYTDSYQYLIGVSLTNVMEPWLNNLVQVLSERQKEDTDVNIIFRDAAGSPEKQIQDIEALMASGIDLLIVSPDGSGDLDGELEEVSEKIPVVMAGVGSKIDCYTSLIQADDEKIGRLAGEYILENLYEEGDRIMVIEGVEGSPISEKRRKGFLDAIQARIPQEKIVYDYGDWLRDQAELRMKDYLVSHDQADIVFAFNDEMAYGAFLACQQYRAADGVHLIGVDGFEGESAGLNLVERGILDATIQSPDFGSMAYDVALALLHGKETAHNITIEPQLITGNE